MEQKPAKHLAFVIEDEVELADLYASAMVKAGFYAQAIYDGQKALSRLQQGDEIPDLIILDLNLPHVSGNEVLNFIRSDSRYTRTRVILATSDASACTGELENTSDIVLLKPIQLSLLRELASRFLLSKAL